MPATAKHLAIFQESVIREMTRLANQHEAINLAQGFLISTRLPRSSMR